MWFIISAFNFTNLAANIAGTSWGVQFAPPETFAPPEKVAPPLQNFAPSCKNRNMINSIVK